MKMFYSLLILLVVTSCFPVQIAPNLKAGKVVKARKFVKHLGPQYLYAFDDPKAANEFYDYVNAKYQTTYDDINGNTPVAIHGNTYYLTFYEVEKQTKMVNMLTPMVGAVLEENGLGTHSKEARVHSNNTWYIALSVTDERYEDALRPGYLHEKEVLRYVKHMRSEYLSTQEYIEVYLKGK